jgi:hypothetical protein
MKNVPWYLVAALAIIIILMILFGRGDPKPIIQEKEFKTQIAILEAEKSEAIGVQDSIKERFNERVQKDSVAIRAFKVENSRLKAKVASIRPRVVQVLIDNPSVDSLVKTLDTLNQKLEIENSRLQYSLQIQGKEFIDLTVAVDSERRANEKIIMESLARVESLEKQVKKKQKGQKLLKVVAVVGTIGAFVLGSQL